MTIPMVDLVRHYADLGTEIEESVIEVLRSGHYVTGHIDGTGKIIELKHEDPWTQIKIEFHKSLSSFLINKGSICIDGISLTVSDLTETTFTVYIIPHTFKNTNLQNKKNGDLLNIECDILGKYVLRNLTLGTQTNE